VFIGGRGVVTRNNIEGEETLETYNGGSGGWGGCVLPHDGRGEGKDLREQIGWHNSTAKSRGHNTAVIDAVLCNKDEGGRNSANMKRWYWWWCVNK
jgi:hypothetical protein